MWLSWSLSFPHKISSFTLLSTINEGVYDSGAPTQFISFLVVEGRIAYLAEKKRFYDPSYWKALKYRNNDEARKSQILVCNNLAEQGNVWKQTFFNLNVTLLLFNFFSWMFIQKISSSCLGRKIGTTSSGRKYLETQILMYCAMPLGYWWLVGQMAH